VSDGWRRSPRSTSASTRRRGRGPSVMAGGPGSTRGLDKDPFASFRFAVKIGNADPADRVCGFSEASGLSVETDVETFREGGVNTHEIQLAGPSKFPSKLVLKRGL